MSLKQTAFDMPAVAANRECSTSLVMVSMYRTLCMNFMDVYGTADLIVNPITVTDFQNCI